MVGICVSSALLELSSQSVPKTPQGRGDVANVRHVANFHPSIWGDHFIQYSKNDVGCSHVQQEIQALKADVRKKLEAVSDKPSQHLKLIGDIDGLGLGYHFEEEIEEAMGSMYEKGNVIVGGYDLYHTSLHFRLLRQHGYRVSSDVFHKFVDANGGIKEELHGDIRGLLGFYEAAQLRIHEDVILEKALNASISILESSPLTRMDMEVKKALKLPFHKDIPRLRTWKYISAYGESKYSHDEDLLKMAKLDFNLLQQRHQYELSQLSIWWKELGMASKCPFGRDRVVELYLWSLALLFEPQYGLARTLFTKVAAIFTFIDDMYDAYGKADELDLLTEAITRWDMSLIEQMPAFMKTVYEALLDVLEEIEGCLAPQGKSYRACYEQKVLQMTSKAYYDEYIWFKNNHVPTMDEYMRVALVSGGVGFLVVTAMVGMGDDDITKESFEWVFKNPKMISACCIIGRLKDDMVSHKFEQARGHPPSAVECYVKQYGVSEQEAYKEFTKQVISGWKDMNECCLKPTPVPFKVLDVILNIARFLEVFYTDGDGLTHAQELMKDEVVALLVNPIPI